MKTIISARWGKVLVNAAAVVLIGIFALGSLRTTQVQAKPEAQSTGLEGTWRVQVTTFNCSTGVKAPPFMSMLTFLRGGVLTETTSSPAFQPGQRSPGHGIWKISGAKTYSAISEAYIQFSSEPNPPAPGFPRGTQRITQTIRLNGNEFNADAVVQFYDVSGKLVMEGCASAAGQRFK